MAKSAPKPKPRKKIFLVDDHPLFREGLVAMIGRTPDLAVCGEAQNARQALAGVEQNNPDLVLLDVSLPGRSGLELTKDLLAIQPKLLILVVSMHDETLFAERVLRAGAHGYIMKQEGPDKMLEAIRQALTGQIYLSPKTASHMLKAFSGQRAKTGSAISELSDRELEIFQLIGRGKDTHAIAAQLNISPKTVDAHRGNIKAKLELKNSIELICRAALWVETEGESTSRAS